MTVSARSEYWVHLLVFTNYEDNVKMTVDTMLDRRNRKVWSKYDLLLLCSPIMVVLFRSANKIFLLTGLTQTKIKTNSYFSKIWFLRILKIATFFFFFFQKRTFTISNHSHIKISIKILKETEYIYKSRSRKKMKKFFYFFQLGWVQGAIFRSHLESFRRQD